MKVTLVREDNMVYVNGQAHKIDLSELPEEYHAVQWNGDKGVIEMIDEDGKAWGSKPIKSFAEFEKYIPLWEAEEARVVAEIEQRQKEQAERNRIAAEEQAAKKRASAKLANMNVQG